MKIKLKNKTIEVAEEDYYDELEEELLWEEEWAELLDKRGTLPQVQQEAIQRIEDLQALQEHYKDFTDFLYDCMTELMGFTCTPIQLDIGDYMQHAPRYAMVQAQRSQAKSSIAAIKTVWNKIHNPKSRTLIISAGSDVANEIANWVIQIIMNWDILKCLRPDRQHGDRASAKAFDIHWQLKGVEKSPSIACIGITSNMAGRRADDLLADDVESAKNGLTEVQRQKLTHLTRDFTSICQKGDIMFLGTPQSSDSIYNALPGRGYEIRIWPGRYPTEEQEEHYGQHLAPFIKRTMEKDPSLRKGGGLNGNQGKPTDPVLLNEELLLAKELDQGEAYFQLQHMLNTALLDKGRHPLKTRDLIVMPLDGRQAPTELSWLPNPERKIQTNYPNEQPELYPPHSIGKEMYLYEQNYVYIDTAGGGRNGDETVAWDLKFLHGYLFANRMLALEGGYNEQVYKDLSKFIYNAEANEVGIEQNHGFGALAQNLRPVLIDYYEEKTGKRRAPKIVDDWVSTQKELRIIDTLEPVMGSHRLVINQDVIDYDAQSVMKYPIDMRQSYTLVHQINKITRDRGALIHDDRADGLAGAVRRFVDNLAVSEKLRRTQKLTNENMEMMDLWLQKKPQVGLGNMLKNKGRRYKRK